jgi:hypothetical protein
LDAESQRDDSGTMIAQLALTPAKALKDALNK